MFENIAKFCNLYSHLRSSYQIVGSKFKWLHHTGAHNVVRCDIFVDLILTQKNSGHIIGAATVWM